MRIEIDHLQTGPAIKAISNGATGLGYNMGGVSYYWTMIATAEWIEVNVEDRLTVRATAEDIRSLAHLPVCGFVSHLVQMVTGNDARKLCALLGR